MGVKKERYEEADDPINKSIDAGQYFEAITIEESIISDRLASFIFATGGMLEKEAYSLQLNALGSPHTDLAH